MFTAAYPTTAKRRAQRRPTEKVNAATPRQSVSRVEFQPPSFETSSFAYPGLFAKSSAVVSTAKNGDDDGAEHLGLGR
jgi:hypothetical protein